MEWRTELRLKEIQLQKGAHKNQLTQRIKYRRTKIRY